MGFRGKGGWPLIGKSRYFSLRTSPKLSSSGFIENLLASGSSDTYDLIGFLRVSAPSSRLLSSEGSRTAVKAQTLPGSDRAVSLRVSLAKTDSSSVLHLI